MSSPKIIAIDLRPIQASIVATMPTSDDRTRILRGLGAAAVATWKKIAQAELRSTARDYIAGISAPVYTKDSVTITLEGRLPNMVEQGWDGGDMREWLLKSPKAKQGKNGPYMVIPFRHGAPGTSGRNVGNEMPQSIYALARKLAPTTTQEGPDGGLRTAWGQRLGLRTKGMTADARGILKSLQRPWHSTSVFMGMVRKAQPTKAGLRTSGYTTFRTISMHTNEPGKHWVHPGIRARELASKANTQMTGMAQQLVSEYLRLKGRR